MSDQGPTPGRPAGEPESPDEAREAALMREVLREQEQHREGGVEPDLDPADTDPGPGDQGS
jgi:hypothetical protein